MGHLGGSCGGGGGGYAEFLFTSPGATYPYGVGAGGSGATACTGSATGGAGGAGYIIVEEHYY